MPRRLSNILKYLVFMGGGIFLIWYQLHSMKVEDKAHFYDSLKHANYWFILPISAMSILSHLSRAARWRLMLEPMGYRPRLSNLFAVTMVGYLANAAVPRLGEVLKCTFLGRYEKLRVDRLIGTIIIERSFDLICFIGFIGITLLVQMGVVGSILQEKLDADSSVTQPSFWIKPIIFLGGVVFIFFLIRAAFRKWPENKIISKVNHFLHGIWEGFSSIKKLKKRGSFLLHTVFIWSMYLGQIWLAFQAIDATQVLGLPQACSVLTMATVAMIVTPGGIGTFPLFVAQTLLLYNIQQGDGDAFGWLMWSVSTGLVLILGFTSLLFLPYINRNQHEIDSASAG